MCRRPTVQQYHSVGVTYCFPSQQQLELLLQPLYSIAAADRTATEAVRSLPASKQALILSNQLIVLEAYARPYTTLVAALRVVRRGRCGTELPAVPSRRRWPGVAYWRGMGGTGEPLVQHLE